MCEKKKQVSSWRAIAQYDGVKWDKRNPVQSKIASRIFSTLRKRRKRIYWGTTGCTLLIESFFKSKNIGKQGARAQKTIGIDIKRNSFSQRKRKKVVTTFSWCLVIANAKSRWYAVNQQGEKMTADYVMKWSTSALYTHLMRNESITTKRVNTSWLSSSTFPGYSPPENQKKKGKKIQCTPDNRPKHAQSHEISRRVYYVTCFLAVILRERRRRHHLCARKKESLFILWLVSSRIGNPPCTDPWATCARRPPVLIVPIDLLRSKSLLRRRPAKANKVSLFFFPSSFDPALHTCPVQTYTIVVVVARARHQWRGKFRPGAGLARSQK